MLVIIWYDYVGHFTNKVYIFSSVNDLFDEYNLDLKSLPTRFSHVAHLRFPEVCSSLAFYTLRWYQD